MRPRGQQLALLLDFENVVLGAGATLPDRDEPVPANAVTWLCRAYGPTTIRRAYADWADPRFGRYQQALERNGIDLVQLGHGPSRKNGADIRMTVDAMETLIVHPSVDAFVLASGDSDFSPLVSKLREFGKHVIGVGAETSASARLVSVCSEYKLWGSIVARTDPRPGSPVLAGQTGQRLADAEELLVTAMGKDDSAVLTASAVKSKMVTLDPAFDEADYGCASFREFLARLGHRVHIVGRRGGDITLALVAPAAQPLESSAIG
ncbi:NYN domain-containing protein [Amycolatopsis thailandensis]|uniref:NYN domain-containing protein n=1 Tax=Amycolatopsis thailandensis TaxID=589330 RepID=A0A229RV66_9PSEU|nr:NYN domain-containing protein [Amycolatopsis thailandensis]